MDQRASQSSDVPSCGFLRLPTELRTLIYDYCFAQDPNRISLNLSLGDDGILREKESQFWSQSSVADIPRVCRLVHHETRFMIWQRTNVEIEMLSRIDPEKPVTVFLERISSSYMQHLKHLMINYQSLVSLSKQPQSIGYRILFTEHSDLSLKTLTAVIDEYTKDSSPLSRVADLWNALDKVETFSINYRIRHRDYWVASSELAMVSLLQRLRPQLQRSAKVISHHFFDDAGWYNSQVAITS